MPHDIGVGRQQKVKAAPESSQRTWWSQGYFVKPSLAQHLGILKLWCLCASGLSFSSGCVQWVSVSQRQVLVVQTQAERLPGKPWEPKPLTSLSHSWIVWFDVGWSTAHQSQVHLFLSQCLPGIDHGQMLMRLRDSSLGCTQSLSGIRPSVASGSFGHQWMPQKGAFLILQENPAFFFL